MTLLVATRNPGKRREFAVLLDEVLPPGTEVVDVGSWPTPIGEVVEDRDTFEGNALKKAYEVCVASGCTTLADDSGLRVDALGGAPGVYSARYAGKDATDADNNAKLLRELDGVPAEDRTARYVAVLCLCLADDALGRHFSKFLGDPVSFDHLVEQPPLDRAFEVRGRRCVCFRATCEGRIGDEPRGEGGFGYDPYFLIDDWGLTMAEVPLSRKNERSHRAAAVRAMAAFLSSGKA